MFISLENSPIRSLMVARAFLGNRGRSVFTRRRWEEKIQSPTRCREASHGGFRGQALRTVALDISRAKSPLRSFWISHISLVFSPLLSIREIVSELIDDMEIEARAQTMLC